jgi:glycosyltransferase involved in cell wall biosynthesis
VKEGSLLFGLCRWRLYRVKVGHLLSELRHSGAEVMLASAAPYLLETGPATIITTGVRVGDYGPTLESAGYKIVHVPFQRSPSFFRTLARSIKAEKIDVLHVHTEQAAAWLSLVGWWIDVPVVRTIHNEFFFTGLLRTRRGLGRRAASFLGTLHVACSPSVQRNEETRFGIRPEVVNNWIDPTRVPHPSPGHRAAARARFGIKTDELLAVSIANEAPAKNLATLFNGVAEAVRRGVPITLLHCGAVGPDLVRLAEAAPSGSIRTLGTVDAVGDYLAACDLLLSTSFNEGGPLSVLEGAAAGAVCITTRVGATEALEGSLGVRFINPDVSSLVNALIEIARIPEADRRAAGAALSKSVRSYFVPERGAREYKNLYERAVDARLSMSRRVTVA